MTNPHFFGSAALLVLMACSSTSPDATGTRTTDPPAGTATTPPTSGGDYVSQFQGLSSKDGLRIGNMNNLRFAFDLQSHLQTYTKPTDPALYQTGGKTEVSPRMIVSFDLGSACFQVGFQGGAVDLPPGDTAWVDHLDLTMYSSAPTPADGSSPESFGNAMCYGYRSNGTWFWEPSPQKATWDPSTQTYQIRFTIQKGPIDAIKVVTGNGPEVRYVSQMVLSTRPQ